MKLSYIIYSTFFLILFSSNLYAQQDDENLKLIDEKTLQQQVNIYSNIMEEKNFKHAKLAILDKVTTKLIHVNLHIDTALQYKNIKLIAEKCSLINDKYQLLLRIFSPNISNKKISDNFNLIFYGWLFSHELSANIFTHSLYDINLVKCF